MQYFGTDGVRGPVDGPLVCPEFFARLGEAVGTVIKADPGSLALIGYDTRASGPELALAVAQGLIRAGWDVRSAGVVPTPAVALATAQGEYRLGVMVTASHNPATDNGVKFFDAEGRKLSAPTEEAIEKVVGPLPEGKKSRKRKLAADAGVAQLYRAVLARRVIGLDLTGTKVVVDSAHGAATGFTAEVLRSIGADVTTLGDQPDGTNINRDCGSEHPEALAQAVRDQGAALGMAHDGDGDRVVVVDETGQVVPGEVLLALWAEQRKAEGRLPGDLLVTTVQSNLGLDRSLETQGIRVERTGVGDKLVAERMREKGAVLGGEESGHFLFLDESPSGDGPLAAIAAVRLLVAGDPVSEWRQHVPLFPQRCSALRMLTKPPFHEVPGWAETLRRVESDLGRDGRLLARYSGTEPKLRLLVEAHTAEQATSLLSVLEAAARQHLPVA